MIAREKQKIDPVLITKILAKIQSLPWLQSVLYEYIELINFCVNAEEENLVNELLEKFLVIDSAKLARIGNDIVAQLSSNYSIASSNTKFYAFSDSCQVDGSQFFLYSLKNKFECSDGWTESHFNNNITNINGHKTQYSKIVLVDDFIGTGHTTIRKVKYVRKVLDKLAISNYSIIVICVAAMGFSKQNLTENGIECIAAEWLKKGIEEHLSPVDMDKNYEIMSNLEARLDKGKHKKFFPYGYGSSEALFSIEGQNTPNNVFPIFWYPYTLVGNRKTMFKALR